MNEVFQDLFVLEGATNHLGNVQRGLKIIREFGKVVRYNNVKAAFKLQLRDMDTFVHKDFRNRQDIRYVKKQMDVRMPHADYRSLAAEIKRQDMILCFTCFDEPSVDFAMEMDVQILKVASSDLPDWGIIEKIAATRLPVIVSTGGSSLLDVDNLVKFFKKRNIPLALNHCVSIYPSADEDLEINQIDFLRHRYPDIDITIGFSTHEWTDWTTSIAIAYAKGARTFERHVDIDMDDVPVSPYCSLPHEIDIWFKAYEKVKLMCGAPGTEKRIPPKHEIAYLDALVRGAYAFRDLPAGHIIQRGDIYLAIPLQKGQLSCREFILGETLQYPLPKDAPLTVDHLEIIPSLRDAIRNRGL